MPGSRRWALSLLLGLLLTTSLAAQAQVGIGTTTPDAKAALDVSATDKGILIPRLTAAQRTAITSPPDGLMIFQTDGTTGFWYYFGGAWVNIPNASTAGDNLGNHIATQKLDLAANKLVGNGGSTGISISNAGAVTTDGAITAGGNVSLGTNQLLGNGGTAGLTMSSAGSAILNTEGTGFIVDAATTTPRVGLMKYTGREGGIWRTSTTKFEIGRTNTSSLLTAPSSYSVDLVVSGSGLTGISTTDPMAKLDIQGGADATGTSDPRALAFQHRNGGYRHWVRTRHNSTVTGSGNALDFYLNNSTAATGSSAPSTGNVQVLTLESNNGSPRVGIGTTTPTATLEVSGATSTVKLGGLAGTGTRLMTVDASGNVSSNSSLPSGVTGDNLGDHTATTNLDLGTNKLVGNGGTNGIYITNNGHVGLNGVTNPGGGAAMLANTAVNTLGSDAQGGNLGSLQWAINTNGYAGSFYNGSSAGSADGLAVKVNGSNGNATVFDVSKGTSQATTGTPLFMVKASGNVGIGTTAPTATLEVSGATSTVKLGGLAGTGTRLMTVDASGNVSSSSSLPTGVTGDNLGNHTATQNLGLATYTLTGNGGTTGLQISANGRLLTTADNLVVGKNTGNASLSGINNTLVGAQSGFSLTTGAANTLTGVNAGNALTSGFQNVFTGLDAGLATTTGDGNVGLGYESGKTNVTGVNNTLVGASADVIGTNLTNATAIGSGAKVSQSNSLVLGNNVKVGIGTTAPSATLEVSGATSTVKLGGLAGTGTRLMTVDASGNVSSSSSLPTGVTGDDLGNHTATQNLNLGANALTGNGGTQGLTVTSGGAIGVGAGLTTPAAGGAQLANMAVNTIGSDNQGGYFSSGTGSLQWGIGGPGYAGTFYNSSTAANANGLAVKVDGSNSGATALDVSKGGQSSQGTPLLTVKAGGLVGIGTASPTTALDVNGTAQAKTYTFPLANASDDAAPVITSREIPATQGNTQTGANQSRPTELILFHSNDGTTNNGGSDQITLRAPQLSFQTYDNTTVNTIGDDNGYNPRLTIDPAGGVTINALAGTGTRVVTADATGNLATVTTASLADNLGNHTATQNLSLGANALTGTGASIGTTVGIGIRADGGLNIGQNTAGNVSLGYEAGQALTTGNSNLFVGYQAGLSTTTGTGNHFTGAQAGYGNTTGSANYFSGYHAGSANTTGNYNLSIGHLAGNATSTADGNHFVGFLAGYTTTGARNQFEGHQSGVSNTTGSQNHFSGFFSGVATTTGANNVFVGYTSGQNNVTGSNNWGFGYDAGPASGSSALTNAGALGYNAKVSQSNSLVLGGTGSDAVSVGIGTTAPAATLHVEGSSSTVRLAGLGGGGTRMVTTDNSGNLSAATIPTGESTTASNGLTLSGSDVRLGGPLTSATTVSTTAANSLTVDGAGAVNLGTGTGATTLGNTTGTTAITGSSTTVTGTTNLNTSGAGSTSIGTGTNSGTVTIGHASGTANAVVISGTATLNGGTSNAATNLGTGAGAVSVGNTTGATTITGSSTTVTGTTNVNTSGSAATNLGTGATAGTVTIGRSGGTVTMGNLTGASTRLVTADASGNLSTATIASVGDNLGNHTATQKLDLSTFKLVGNGGTLGIGISNAGVVTTDGALTTGGAITAGGKVDLGANALVGNGGTVGLTISSAGVTTAGGNLNLGANRLVGSGGTLGVSISSGGQVGVGSITPALGQLSNTTTNIIGADGNGVNFTSGVGSLAWAMSTNGYVGALYNGSTLSNGHGLAVKIDGSNSAASILDLSTGAQGTAGTSRLVVKADGSVGIGKSSPTSTLHVGGTLAVGTSTGLAGGASGSPTVLGNTSASYFGVNPTSGTTNYYQLPDPSTCAGRMYVIRNNNGSNSAILTTAAGSLYAGSSTAPLTTYTLNPASAVKTVIIFSDGTNWTVGQLN